MWGGGVCSQSQQPSSAVLRGPRRGSKLFLIPIPFLFFFPPEVWVLTEAQFYHSKERWGLKTRDLEGAPPRLRPLC